MNEKHLLDPSTWWNARYKIYKHQKRDKRPSRSPVPLAQISFRPSIDTICSIRRLLACSKSIRPGISGTELPLKKLDKHMIRMGCLQTVAFLHVRTEESLVSGCLKTGFRTSWCNAHPRWLWPHRRRTANNLSPNGKTKESPETVCQQKDHQRSSKFKIRSTDPLRFGLTGKTESQALHVRVSRSPWAWSMVFSVGEESLWCCWVNPVHLWFTKPFRTGLWTWGEAWARVTDSESVAAAAWGTRDEVVSILAVVRNVVNVCKNVR